MLSKKKTMHKRTDDHGGINCDLEPLKLQMGACGRAVRNGDYVPVMSLLG